MKIFKNHILMAGLLLSTFNLIAQDDTDDGGSVIQNLTPSKLIGKGQWDLKLFNNLYTQDDSTFESDQGIRQNFFTSTLEAFTGVSDTKRVNIGAIVEYRANGRDFVLGDGSTERRTTTGITSIAPAIKFVPFKSVGNFSILSAFSIPLISQEVDDNGVFLDQDGVFLSYFPSSKFTVLVLGQHTELINLGNDFSQNFTALGGGAKYQLTKELNLEVLYTNFVAGRDTGLGETFNIGLRAVF